jgi:hypothetical protein
MNVFVSYAAERREAAASIAVALRQDDHDVFFDRSALPAGEGFHRRIREEIRRCDLFLFLFSPESVAPSSYALTELGLAEDRWPDPSGHVLPVVLERIAMVPPYLSVVSRLEPRGDLVAEVVARVAEIAATHRRRLWRTRVVLAAIAGVVATIVWLSPLRFAAQAQPCYVTAQLRARDAGSPIPPGMILDVTYAGGTNSFVVSETGLATIQVGPLVGRAARWTIDVRAADGHATDTQQVDGCPTNLVSQPLGRNLVLELAPH